MNKWLRDKFAASLRFFFIFSIILSTVAGGIGGFALGDSFGWNYYSGGIIWLILLGLIIGCLFGIIFGIIKLGYFATIVHISESLDKENSNQHNCDKSKLEISKTEQDRKNEGSSDDEYTDDEYTTVIHDGVEVLEKDGKYYCPNCFKNFNSKNGKCKYCDYEFIKH